MAAKRQRQGSIEGSSDWNSIARLLEDVDTEKYSRLADMINNMSYVDPGTVSLKGGYQRGQITQRPKIETEDQRMQALRRNAEDKRRTWNSGQAQEQMMFNQNMALLAQYRQFKQQLAEKGMTIEDVLSYTNATERRMRNTQEGTPETRNWALQGLDSLYMGFLDMMESLGR